MKKQNNGVFLGFDTSNYTTSIALCTYDGEIIQNLKLPLPVGDGERGLRQSDALFHHINRLPDLIEQLDIKDEIIAVGYSARPRDVLGSYMPCFLAGKAVATSAARAANTKAYDFSHQCGHIMAALYSAKRQELIDKEFYAFHISGGTTEILHAAPSDKYVFNIEKIGGTLDLNAGQVIDRTGVLMGLHFPCGAELEALAALYNGEGDRFKISVVGTECNLSGLEAKAAQLYSSTADKNRVSAFVLDSITETLLKMTENLLEKHGSLPIIYAGGVMSCLRIKDRLSRFGSFAAPQFSSDNAAGVALLTRLAYLKEG